MVLLTQPSSETLSDTDLIWKIRLYVWPCGCLSFLYILLAYPRTIRSLVDTFWHLSRCQHVSPFACTISCIHLEFCILFNVTIGCVFSKLICLFFLEGMARKLVHYSPPPSLASPRLGEDKPFWSGWYSETGSGLTALD